MDFVQLLTACPTTAQDPPTSLKQPTFSFTFFPSEDKLEFFLDA